MYESQYNEEYKSEQGNNWFSRNIDLRVFVEEFKFAFEENPKLKKYLPKVFEELTHFM